MLARIHRSLVNSINSNKQGFLPKYYLFVLYDDLITYLDYCHEDGLATLLGTWVEWLANEPEKLIKTRRDEVPDKSKKLPTPFLYWVAAPTHSFFSKERKSLHIKFNLCLESVIRTKDNMRIIKLKEYWNTKDSNLVINDRMTELGLTSYWCAVDASFRFNVQKHEIFVAKDWRF